jgi:hypothetical protein
MLRVECLTFQVKKAVSVKGMFQRMSFGTSGTTFLLSRFGPLSNNYFVNAEMVRYVATAVVIMPKVNDSPIPNILAFIGFM